MLACKSYHFCMNIFSDFTDNVCFPHESYIFIFDKAICHLKACVTTSLISKVCLCDILKLVCKGDSVTRFFTSSFFINPVDMPGNNLFFSNICRVTKWFLCCQRRRHWQRMHCQCLLISSDDFSPVSMPPVSDTLSV